MGLEVRIGATETLSGYLGPWFGAPLIPPLPAILTGGAATTLMCCCCGLCCCCCCLASSAAPRLPNIRCLASAYSCSRCFKDFCCDFFCLSSAAALAFEVEEELSGRFIMVILGSGGWYSDLPSSCSCKITLGGTAACCPGRGGGGFERSKFLREASSSPDSNMLSQSAKGSTTCC